MTAGWPRHCFECLGCMATRGNGGHAHHSLPVVPSSPRHPKRCLGYRASILLLRKLSEVRNVPSQYETIRRWFEKNALVTTPPLGRIEKSTMTKP